MSNRLEDFISGNRDQFDNNAPSGKVWEKIEASFTDKRKIKRVHIPLFKWSISAAAILIIGITFYFNLTKTEPGRPLENDRAKIVNSLPEDYDPQVYKFAKLIDLKQEELKLLAKEQPQLYQKFTKDITQLDSSYNALKSQLSVTPNKEMLIEAMIQNLQLQLSVLNQQLNIIKQIKQSKDYSHEKNHQNI